MKLIKRGRFLVKLDQSILMLLEQAQIIYRLIVTYRIAN